MKDTRFAQSSFNSLHTDFKVEVVALNLLRFYQEIDHLFLKRLGGNHRSFHKDIKAISVDLFNAETDIVTIESYRESIYDYLPNGVFHSPTLGGFKKNTDSIIEEIRHQRKIEESARKLFEPFENEIFYLQLSILMQENQYDISDNTTLLVEVLDTLFPLLEKIDAKTARIFVFLLPFFHATKGNKKWFERCLSAFLKIPVHIVFLPNKVDDIQEVSEYLVLSQMYLGQSLVLSGSHWDGERNWGIYYGAIPYQDLEHYMPCATLRKLLITLYDYCLPVGVKVEEFFVVEPQGISFTLQNTQMNTNRLGYSTFI